MKKIISYFNKMVKFECKPLKKAELRSLDEQTKRQSLYCWYTRGGSRDIVKNPQVLPPLV